MKSYQYRRFRDQVVEHYEAMGAARQSEIDRIERSLRAGTSVIVTGHRGIGKSHIAAALVARIEPGRQDPNDAAVIVCTRASDVARLRRLRDEGTDDAGILTIEDAHALSTDDLRVLVDVASSTDRPVLITVNIDPSRAPVEESVARTQLITALWAELGLERVDLSGIGFTEASAIMDEICGDSGLDVVTRARIVHGASGVPMLVEELTREALRRTGSVDLSSASLILGPTTLPARILDLAQERIAGLSAADEYALITLAKIGTASHMRASRLVGRAPLRALLRRGLVTHEPGAFEYVSANMLYAHAAQSLLDVENPLEAEHAVEHLLLDDLRAGQPLSSVECVLVAAYWATAPGAAHPDDGIGAVSAAAVLARAARRAEIWGLPAWSEMFARRSLAESPSIPAVHSLSRALAGLGHIEAALEVIERDTTPHTSARDDADLVWWWHLLIVGTDVGAQRRRTLHDRVAEWGSVDELIADLDTLVRLRVAMMASGYEHGTAAMLAYARDATRPVSLRLRAYTQVLPAYDFLGDQQTVNDVLDEGRALVGDLASARNGRTYTDDYTAAALFIAKGGFLVSTIGETRVQLARDLDVYALRAVLLGNDLELALVNAVSGSMSLSTGRASSAEVELAHAEVGVARKFEPDAVVMVRLLRASSLFALNRRDEAAEILGGMSSGELRIEPWIEFYGGYIDVLLRADPSDAARTHAELIALARLHGGRGRHISMTALYLASRAGAPAAALVAVIDSLDGRGHSVLADVYEEHLRAAAAADPHRLDAVASTLEQFSLRDEAGHAFALAADAHAARGRTAHATASRERRDAQYPRALEPAADTGSVSTPPRDNVVRLTRRELEIAQLVASGLSNSEIAGQLFLSVRTVESHVLQARVKLGARRRAELGLYVANVERQVS